MTDGSYNLVCVGGYKFDLDKLGAIGAGGGLDFYRGEHTRIRPVFEVAYSRDFPHNLTLSLEGRYREATRGTDIKPESSGMISLRTKF